MAKGNFKTDLIRGKVGEDEFIKLAGKAGWIVQDTSNDPKYWKQDVDFIITDKEGIDRKIEIKWDYRIHQTNNFFIETVSSVRINSDGWIKKTKAEMIFYGDAKNRIFYCFNPIDMLEYCDKHKPRVVEWYNKETGTVVRGFLVNFFDYQKKGYKLPIITLP